MRKMVILNNIKNTLSHKALFLVFCFLTCFSIFTTKVVDAKTINSSSLFADSTRLDYVDNLFKRSKYHYYLLSVENTYNGYSNYSYYYLCLTNESINITDTINASANCDEMYVYYRNGSNNYVLEKYNDNKLVVNNSVYYTSNTIDNLRIIEVMIVSIFISLLIYFFTRLLLDLWG